MISWIAVSPPVPPVKPTYPVFPPIVDGMFTFVKVVVNSSSLVKSVIVIARFVPLYDR